SCAAKSDVFLESDSRPFSSALSSALSCATKVCPLCWDARRSAAFHCQVRSYGKGIYYSSNIAQKCQNSALVREHGSPEHNLPSSRPRATGPDCRAVPYLQRQAARGVQASANRIGCLE